MTESWVEKHRPESWQQIQGNNKSIKQIRKWAENWSEGDQPQLLVGPPGVGKTTTAYVASDELGYPLNQINASEARRSKDLRRIVRSMKSSPAGGDHQLVLLDEVDNWHHSVDKSDLYDALRNPKNPIILTANVKYDVPDAIKRASNVHDFKLGVRSRKAKLKEVAEREGIDLDQQDLSKLAERPDLRSAINDLQNYSGSGLPADQDQRTWSEGEFDAVQALLGGDYPKWRKSVSPRDNSFSDPSWLMLWLDENLKQEWRGLEAGIGYDTLSRADRWLGRAQSYDYRYWKYASELMKMVDETRLSDPYEGYISVDFPNWVRSSEPSPDGSTNEAKLFQALKKDRGYRMSGSFYEFRQRLLPILQDLPEEEKMELALNYGLDADAIKALGLTESDFEDWRELESPEEGDGWSPDSDSAADASW